MTDTKKPRIITAPSPGARSPLPDVPDFEAAAAIAKGVLPPEGPAAPARRKKEAPKARLKPVSLRARFRNTPRSKLSMQGRGPQPRLTPTERGQRITARNRAALRRERITLRALKAQYGLTDVVVTVPDEMAAAVHRGSRRAILALRQMVLDLGEAQGHIAHPAPAQLREDLIAAAGLREAVDGDIIFPFQSIVPADYGRRRPKAAPKKPRRRYTTSF